MTRREVINSYRADIAMAKKRIEVDMLRMETGEIKELKHYIEKTEIAVRALEIVDGGFCKDCEGWNEVGK